MALVVDEAHCIQTWGDDFHISFAEIGNLRSVLPQHLSVMALTATATRTTFDTIAEKLALQNPKMIVLSPERLNILYRLIHQLQ